MFEMPIILALVHIHDAESDTMMQKMIMFFCLYQSFNDDVHFVKIKVDSYSIKIQMYKTIWK